MTTQDYITAAIIDAITTLERHQHGAINSVKLNDIDRVDAITGLEVMRTKLISLLNNYTRVNSQQ